MSLMAKQQKAKAEEFISAAESKLQSKGWSMFSSKERDAEDAAEAYEKAANAYKVGGLHQEAGDAYMKAADLYRTKANSPTDASKCINNAATMYSKCNPAAAVDTYKQAIALYTDSGRIVQAAKLSKEVATIYETEQIDADGKSYVVLAMEAYEQASQLFEMENSKSQASQCLAKIAELCSAALTPPDYERAAQIYGDMGRRCLDSNLLKFNAKGHFLHSIMCVLARNDAVGAQQALAKFQSLDYTFADSREGKFAAQIVECVDGMDVEGFATACFEFDRITKLDPWKTSVLNNIRQLIADDDGGDDDDDDVDLT